MKNLFPTLVTLLFVLSPIPAQGTAADGADIDLARSELRPMIERWSADLALLERGLPEVASPARHGPLRTYHLAWQQRLEAVAFDNLGADGRLDLLLFENHLRRVIRRLDRDVREAESIASLLPFASDIFTLDRARREFEKPVPEASAATLESIVRQVAASRKALEDGLAPGTDAPAAGGGLKASKIEAARAARSASGLRALLAKWFKDRDAYDPLFSWWNKKPFEKADRQLGEYAAFLREKVAGLAHEDARALSGNPVGREAILEALDHELIAYSPEELMRIADVEMAWCDEQLLAAARALGHGDDWKKALEDVKQRHVAPGEQPSLIVELAHEAIRFIEEKELMTLSPSVKTSWRMEMMTAERQLVNPFFTGGEVISVSFPTSEMEHADKLMSLRGNNRHFSRATVFHELIPGHHLQLFMMRRFKPWREPFATPFWMEGWALYCEMLFWDKEFPRSPEDRIGMLFWRRHRSARILFSLGFHLGRMTAEECVDLLVDRVGHERSNAEGEVRRSFNGSYPPLYQAAYLLGGLQLRALHRELVAGGVMGEKVFHDACLREGSIPIALLRARLLPGGVPREPGRWRFYGDPPIPK